MFVDNAIQLECSRALDPHYQGQCDREQMVFDPVSFLVSKPVQKEAESEMNRCNSAHHRKRDDQGGNSAEKPDDQSDSTQQSPPNYQQAQSQCKSQIFVTR